MLTGGLKQFSVQILNVFNQNLSTVRNNAHVLGRILSVDIIMPVSIPEGVQSSFVQVPKAPLHTNESDNDKASSS